MRYAALLALLLVPGSEGWCNGDGVGLEMENYARNMRPVMVTKVGVLREDLSVSVLELPAYGARSNPGLGHFQADYEQGGLARVRAEYLLQNRTGTRAKITIRFPVEQFWGAEADPDHPQYLRGRFVRSCAPSVKLGRKRLAACYQGFSPTGDDDNSLWDGTFHEYPLWGCDSLFLDAVTHRLHRLRRLDRFPPAFGFLGFVASLQPRERSRLAVQYLQRFRCDLGQPNRWQLTYIMQTAQNWKHWGTTDITVRVPRGHCEHIAVRPNSSSHEQGPEEHVYRVSIGKPAQNLHLAVDLARPPAKATG